MSTKKHEARESKSYERREKSMRSEPEYKRKGNKPTRGGKRC